MSRSRIITLEVRVPNDCVKHIIGPQGSVIKEVSAVNAISISSSFFYKKLSSLFRLPSFKAKRILESHSKTSRARVRTCPRQQQQQRHRQQQQQQRELEREKTMMRRHEIAALCWCVALLGASSVPSSRSNVSSWTRPST